MKRFLVIYLGILFLTTATIVEAVGTMIVMAYAGVATAGALTAAQIAIAMVINFAVSTLVSRAFAPKLDLPSQKDNGVRQQIPPSSTNGIPVVYGDAYLGGVFCDAVLSQDQKTMYYVMAISNISPNGQFLYDTSKFYYADRLCAMNNETVTSLTDGAGNVDTKINGNLFIYLYTSSQSGVITPYNTTLMPHEVMGGSDIISNLRWTSTGRQMNGIAFAIIKLNYNRDAETTQLQPLTYHVSHYLNNKGAATPGDVWYDYITNSQYGGAINSSNVSLSSANDLNLYSNQLITFNDSNGDPATQPRYRINGVLDVGQNVLDNIDKILVACDSWMAYNSASGSWAIVINKAENPSLAFTDDNIIGQVRVSATDITQSINQIEAKFPFKSNRDQYDYVYLETPQILRYPNEPDNKYSATYEMVNDSVQAKYLANRTLEQSREDLIVSIQTTYNGIQVNAGDVVTITNTSYGWSAKPFRVTKVNESSLPDGNLGASLELNEYNAQIYDDKDITQYQPAANSYLASPSYFSNLSAPTITGIDTTATVPNFDVNCTLPSIGRVTSVVLFYTTVSSPTTSDWVVWGTQTSTTSTPFTPSTTIQFSDISLPTDTYYFAYTLVNASSQSGLSPLSIPLSWNPNPTTTATAGTFVAQWSPVVWQVPRTGGVTPVFTGIQPQLYGTAAGGSINFTEAQSDTDPLFINNSWRIGGSSTTGNADIIKSNITIGNPIDGGSYAQFPEPTGMSAQPATITVPVRYKDSLGNVAQGANTILTLNFLDPGSTGPAGASGTKATIVYLYQWATSQPSNPNGTSQFNWNTNTHSSYTGTGGWDVVVPSNPATPLIQLWVASIGISASATTTITSVDWTSGYSVYALSQNGQNGANGAAGTNGINGLQTANARVYQWALTIPSAPIGSATYTWASATFTPTPSGWTLAPSAIPSQGFTLYEASVSLLDSSANSTTSFNWSSSTISGISYAGTNGSSGTSGSSARICYAVVTGSSLNTTPTTFVTSGSSSFPPSNTWGGSETWQATVPTFNAGQSIFQSDGIYNPVTNQTTWNVPYISSLKVGSLSAITTNTGTLNVSGSISSSNGNFFVNSNGEVTIRNSTTGARLVISNSLIAVYDSNSVLRVRLGIW